MKIIELATSVNNSYNCELLGAADVLLILMKWLGILADPDFVWSTYIGERYQASVLMMPPHFNRARIKIRRRESAIL